MTDINNRAGANEKRWNYPLEIQHPSTFQTSSTGPEIRTNIRRNCPDYKRQHHQYCPEIRTNLRLLENHKHIVQ